MPRSAGGEMVVDLLHMDYYCRLHKHQRGLDECSQRCVRAAFTASLFSIFHCH